MGILPTSVFIYFDLFRWYHFETNVLIGKKNKNLKVELF